MDRGFGRGKQKVQKKIKILFKQKIIPPRGGIIFERELRLLSFVRY